MSSVTRKFSGSSVLHPFLILCSNGVPLGRNDTNLPVGNPCKATAPHTPWPLGPPEAYCHRKDLVTATLLLPSFDLHPTVVFPAWAASSGAVSPHAGLWNWPRAGPLLFPSTTAPDCGLPWSFPFPTHRRVPFQKATVTKDPAADEHSASHGPPTKMTGWLQTPSGSTSR